LLIRCQAALNIICLLGLGRLSAAGTADARRLSRRFHAFSTGSLICSTSGALAAAPLSLASPALMAAAAGANNAAGQK